MSKGTILIVADNGILDTHLRDMLTELGYDVREQAASFGEAIAAAERLRPNLIIMDNEPDGEVTGIEAAEIIRVSTGIPVIFLTGYPEEPLRLQACESTHYSFQVKPVQKRELAAAIDLALYRSGLDRKLKESEERFRLFFGSMDSGFALHEIILDTEGKPYDYRFLEVNPAFERLTGLKAETIIGRTVREVLPGTERFWIDTYGRVALTGESVQFKNYTGKLNKYYEVAAYSPKHGQFSAIFKDVTERKQIEEAQLFMVECGCRGDDFFESLARWLAEHLCMDYVCIDRLEPDRLEASTLSIYFDGRFEDNVTYTLKDTPCGEVVGRTVCCFPREVRHLFPNDTVLQEMMAESYVGTTLWSSQGQPIGLIAVIGRYPLENSRVAETILKLAGVRAAGELERRRAEDSLIRLNRELQAISKCNLILVRATDEQMLLEAVCRVICEEAGYQMAWIGFAEHDESKTVRTAAWGGNEDGYLAKANITWADTELGRGPSGTAIRSGKVCICQDFSLDPNVAHWRENALQRGYRSSIVLPLFDEKGTPFGILNIYSSEPNVFTPEEVELLGGLSDNLAFGILSLRSRDDRERAEEALRERTNELTKRVRELDCLYGIARLAEKSDLSINDILQEASESLPPAWLYPEIACARIVLDGQAFITSGFQETIWKQASEMRVHGALSGAVEVYYREERPASDEGPFHKEERALIDAVAGRLGKILERIYDGEALRESEATLRTLINTYPESVFLMETDGRVLVANETTAYRLGVRLDQIVGASIYDLLPDEVALSRRRRAETVVSNKIAAHFEDIRSGRNTDNYCFPIFSEDGKVIKLAIMGIDITERKNLEEKIVRLRNENERFMRHELKNMFIPIKGYSDLLLIISDNLTENQRRFLEAISTGVEKGIGIIDNLKKLHDIESGDQPLERASWVLADIVENAVINLSLFARDLGVIIDLAGNEKKSLVNLDLNLIPGVFLNLIKNAIEHVADLENESDRVVKVKIFNEIGKIVVSINNKGKPVPPEKLATFFEKFNSDRKKKKDGSGLGTTYAYLVTRAHGGNIRVESNDSEGTTVTVEFDVIRQG